MSKGRKPPRAGKSVAAILDLNRNVVRVQCGQFLPLALQGHPMRPAFAGMALAAW
jgi:hypothetical protein